MGEFIHILIPIAETESLSPQVLYGLTTISQPYKVFIHSGEPTSPDRVYGIVENRNSLIQVCNLNGYNLLMDSDVILEEGIIEILLEDLKNNPEVGASAICTRGARVRKLEPPHVNISLMMLSGSLLSQLKFRYAGTGCECLNFVSDIRELGYTVRYATDKRVLEEVTRY